jgi:plasmid stabilization system protein ParE
MTRNEIEHMWKVASNNPNHDTNWHDPVIEQFAELVAQHERKKLQGQIETLGAMYDLANKQRDQLMGEQRAQVAAWRAEHAMNKAKNA